jgi:predicted O-methyltransferase YrrM
MIKKIKSFIKNLRLKRAFRILSNRLATLPQKFTSQDVMNFLFSKEGSLITPWQFKSEILRLLQLYESRNIKFGLEIGTANGGTLFAHCKLAHENATIISIDLPGGKFGGGYPDWKIPLYQKFAKKDQNLHLIRASSHDHVTVEKARTFLSGNQLDYLFIDGDHTYEGVKKDFDLYSPLVKKGGLIVFHDIVPHESSACKVDVFWNEIKKQYQHKEFIDQPTQKKFGVGVLFAQ